MMSMKKSTFCLVLIASLMLSEFTPAVEAYCNRRGCCNCTRQISGGCVAKTKACWLGSNQPFLPNSIHKDFFLFV